MNLKNLLEFVRFVQVLGVYLRKLTIYKGGAVGVGGGLKKAMV